eukprot:maker-scaffold545_size140784-snap-gene-0.22 protein:Tk11088 transcript:maker-scaffold545_size140784-snap-gene-0.22-mRNA-1 annotation:"es1 protein mitochondrial-like"
MLTFLNHASLLELLLSGQLLKGNHGHGGIDRSGEDNGVGHDGEQIQTRVVGDEEQSRSVTPSGYENGHAGHQDEEIEHHGDGGEELEDEQHNPRREIVVDERGEEVLARRQGLELAQSQSPFFDMGDDNVAVILSGCGVFDGTEIHEVAAACAALTKAGKNPVFYAPDKKLFHEVNHVSGAGDDGTSRNVLVESARIARGKVHPLTDLTVDGAQALVFPGGFGAAKNLSTFGVSDSPTLDPDVERVLLEFHSAQKPIGLCCIAPALAAMTFGNKGIKVKLTLGQEGEGWPYGGTIAKAKGFGVEVVEMGVDEICIDEANKIVTTPAFMYDGKFHEIQEGVTKMINALIDLL